MLFLSFLLTFAAPNDKNLNPKKAMSSKTKITVAYGDGIGPEIMNATLAILDAAGAQLVLEWSPRRLIRFEPTRFF
jgi:isocitrate dehydrogenase